MTVASQRHVLSGSIGRHLVGFMSQDDPEKVSSQVSGVCGGVSLYFDLAGGRFWVSLGVVALPAEVEQTNERIVTVVDVVIKEESGLYTIQTSRRGEVEVRSSRNRGPCDAQAAGATC